MKSYLLVIYCSSIDRVKSFYENIGFTFQAKKHGNGPDHYSTIIDGTVIELYPCKEGVSPSNCRLGFELVKSELNNSQLSSIQSQANSKKSFGAGKTLYILKDPDNRKIEILV